MAEPTFTDTRTVYLRRMRLSFPDTLLTPGVPKSVADGTPKYGVNLLNETSNPHYQDNDRKIREALAEAGRQFKGNPDLYKVIAENDPKRVAYRSGARFRNEKGEIYEGYEGNFVISGTGPRGGKERPTLKDRRKRDITHNDKDIPVVMYGGSYCDVFVSFYGTDKGGLGIFCSIELIHSHEEGERMGGGRVTISDDMLADLPDDDSFDNAGSSGSTSGSLSDFGV